MGSYACLRPIPTPASAHRLHHFAFGYGFGFPLKKENRVNVRLNGRTSRCINGGKGLPIAAGGSRLRCNSQLSPVELAPATSAAYGALLLGGGLFAYTRTGSKGSLLGGLVGAALMSTAYFLMQASETKEAGDALAFGSAFLFAAVFGIRLAATRKLIPAGPLLGLSVGAMAVFFSAYLQ